MEVNVDGLRFAEELIEGGESLRVNNTNKEIFVDLMVDWEMSKSVET